MKHCIFFMISAPRSHSKHAPTNPVSLTSSVSRLPPISRSHSRRSHLQNLFNISIYSGKSERSSANYTQISSKRDSCTHPHPNALVSQNKPFLNVIKQQKLQQMKRYLPFSSIHFSFFQYETEEENSRRVYNEKKREQHQRNSRRIDHFLRENSNRLTRDQITELYGLSHQEDQIIHIDLQSLTKQDRKLARITPHFNRMTQAQMMKQISKKNPRKLHKEVSISERFIQSSQNQISIDKIVLNDPDTSI